MAMKINNLTGNYNAANAAKKGSKPPRKENAAAQPKKFDRLTISGEGTEGFRKSVSGSGNGTSYGAALQRKNILTAGLDYNYNLSKEADKLNEAEEAPTWETRLDNLEKAYNKLRDEIMQGCESGTRQVNVIDEGSETGYRTLTVEEELSALDAAYEKTLKAYEEMSPQQEQAKEIIDEWQEQVAGIKGGQPAETEEMQEEPEQEKEQNESKGMVGINAGKLARMLAAAKTRGQVQAVMSKIQSDLSECEAGRNNGMDVDEDSVKAAEQLLQEAKARLGSAENREATPQEEMAAAIASLM